MAKEKKKLVEGVDFEFVKGKNTNAMVRNIFSKAEKAERASKTVAVSKPAAVPTPKPKAKPAPTKPKARPAGLNPQSGAARSTAGKVKPASTVKRPAKAAEISGQKTASSLSGASRSTAGKVPPKKTYAKTPLTLLKEVLAGGGLSNYMKKK
jgi:hypothetical protein